MNTTSNRLHQQTLGGLLGVAVGDALGATTEFLTPEHIATTHGRHTEITGGGTFNWRPGQGTDDTDLTAAVLRAHLDGYTLDKIAKNFLDWYDTDPPDIGITTRTALLALAQTGDPTTSGARDRNMSGNGSLMRCIPTALIHHDDHELRHRRMAEISAVTHANDECVGACLAYGDIIAMLMAGHPVDAAIAHAADNLTGPATHHIHDALTIDPATPVDQIRTSGYVLHSLAAAAWAIQQPADLETILIDLVNQGNDSDTTAAIAGGLLGVDRGASHIPARWVDAIEYREEFELAALEITQ